MESFERLIGYHDPGGRHPLLLGYQPIDVFRFAATIGGRCPVKTLDDVALPDSISPSQLSVPSRLLDGTNDLSYANEVIDVDVRGLCG